MSNKKKSQPSSERVTKPAGKAAPKKANDLTAESAAPPSGQDSKKNMIPLNKKLRDQAYSQVKAYSNAGHISDVQLRKFVNIIKQAKVIGDLDEAFDDLKTDIAQRDPIDTTGFVALPISKKKRVLRWSIGISLVLYLGISPLTMYSYLSFGILLIAVIVLYGFKLPYMYGR